MNRNDMKLLIVADLGKLRALRVQYHKNRSPSVEALEEFSFEDAHQRVVEKVSDLAGRHKGPSPHPGAAPVADDHNLRLETRRRIVKQIAKQTAQLVRAHNPEGFWFAAPKDICNQILEELPQEIRAKAAATAPRDLTKLPSRELVEIFDPEAFKRFAPRDAP